jgi:hypothetical protein
VGSEPLHVILSADFMILRLTTVHENARSALECGSEAAALIPSGKAVAGAAALQGAFGTTILMGVASFWNYGDSSLRSE